MGGESEMNSIPKGYKKTEVGVIPEDWETTRLGHLFDFLYGKQLPSHIVGHQNYPVYGTNGPFKTVNSYLFNGESIIVGRKGAIRAIHYAPSNAWVIDTAFYSIQKQTICMKAIYYRMSLIDLSQMDSGSAIPSTNKQELENIRIALPPLREQKAIAEVLSDMDALIEAQKELIAKKRYIKQGTMEDLLSGRVRLPGYETKGWKHTDIGDIPNDWEVSQIGKIADIISGGTPKTTEKSFWNGTILWCTPTDITRTSGRYIENTEKTITDNGLKNSSAILLPINSLLLCSRATVGDVRIAKHEITTNQGFKSLVCNSSAYYLFIYYLIPFLKPKMLEKSYGSTFLEISKSNLASIQIQLPSYIEQKTIAETLSDMDDEIETLEAELKKLNHMKRGMMQELLTGRIRLI